MGRRDPQPLPSGLTLDAGALIALDRGSRAMRDLVQGLMALRVPIVVPAPALAQAWRGGTRNARLARLLKSDEVQVEALTESRSRAVGETCGLRGVSDVVDVFVALTARRYGGVVVTSDPDDLLRIDPSLTVRAVSAT